MGLAASSRLISQVRTRVANWFLTLGGHSWLLLCTGWLGRGEYGQLCRSKIRYHLVSLSRRPRLMGGGCLSGWVTGQASLSPHARHAAPSRHSASPTAWQGEAPHMPSPSSLLRPYGRGQGMYENKIHGPAVIHLWQPSGHPPGLHSRPHHPPRALTGSCHTWRENGILLLLSGEQIRSRPSAPSKVNQESKCWLARVLASFRARLGLVPGRESAWTRGQSCA